MKYLLDTNTCIRYINGRAPIGPYDMQIAAIAQVHVLTVVTHNTREFGCITGLLIEDWEVYNLLIRYKSEENPFISPSFRP